MKVTVDLLFSYKDCAETLNEIFIINNMSKQEKENFLNNQVRTK